jgi:hypothetical protein
MGWELRNGRRYYYQKRRVGDSVVSEYVGAEGGMGSLVARHDELRRETDALMIAHARLIDAEMEEIDSDLKRVSKDVRLCIRGLLLAAGYRTHKGQWRRKRDGGE